MVYQDATGLYHFLINIIPFISNSVVKLEKIWRSGEIEFLLVLSTLLYGCETWTLLEESKKKIRGFESKAHKYLEYKL